MVKSFDEYMEARDAGLMENKEIQTVDLPAAWEAGLIEGKFDDYDAETKALIEAYIEENKDTKFIEVSEDLGILESNDALDDECEVARYVVEFTEPETE